MKRNWDVIREILLKMEESNMALSLSDFDKDRYDEITYHVRLLEEGELIKASIADTSCGAIIDLERLTWDGHDFLDAIRSVTIWDKTKTKIAEKGGAMSFELIKSVAITLATASLGIGI